jgi:hypothetical protein
MVDDQDPRYQLIDPSTGTVVGTFYEDGSGDVEIQPEGGTPFTFADSPSDPTDVARLQDTGGFDTIEVFESDGTFDASNVDSALVECVGGGGGGASVDGNQANYEVGGAGGGGEYAASLVDLSASSSESVTVGDGGSGATSGNTAGADGGASSFGSLVSANAGSGGPTATTNSLVGGLGGSGGVGDILAPGGNGQGSYTSSATPTEVTTSAGGDSRYGTGGNMIRFGIPPLNGDDANGYGGGGGGPVTEATQRDGGNGTAGVVIVRY